MKGVEMEITLKSTRETDTKEVFAKETLAKVATIVDVEETGLSKFQAQPYCSV